MAKTIARASNVVHLRIALIVAAGLAVAPGEAAAQIAKNVRRRVPGVRPTRSAPST